MKYCILFFSLLCLFQISAGGQDRLPLLAKDEKPENIIIVFSGSMGLSQLMLLQAEQEESLNFFRFPIVGFMRNRASDNFLGDAASNATAIATGEITHTGVIGMNSEIDSVPTLLEIAASLGKNTGIISSFSLTSPELAAFYAHQKSDKRHESIAKEMVEENFHVAIGGGMKYFKNRSDGLNLIMELEKKQYDIIVDDKHLKRKGNRKLIALLADDQIRNTGKFDADKYFLGMAWRRSIRILQRSTQGFFLVISHPHIENAARNNDQKYLLEEMRALDALLGEILDFCDGDNRTLILLTGHYESAIPAIYDYDTKKNNAHISWAGKRNYAVPVPVFASGKGSDFFKGWNENTDIFKKIKYLME
jgi:alkaline phosphatase